MPAIEVNGLSKAFRTYKKQPGFRGALKGLLLRTYEQTHAHDHKKRRMPAPVIRKVEPRGNPHYLRHCK